MSGVWIVRTLPAGGSVVAVFEREKEALRYALANGWPTIEFTTWGELG